MKYYTGTHKRRKTRRSKSSDSGDGTKPESFNTDESLQTSTEIKESNPRKRGRPRKSSNCEPGQNEQVKRPNSKPKKEPKSTQSTKSERSKDESEDEKKKTNPRKRGRPRTSSNIEPEQNTQVKRSKSDSKKDLKTTQRSTKSTRSKDESEDEHEVDEKVVQKSRNNRQTRKVNSTNKVTTSTPVQKPVGRQSKEKYIKKKESKKSSSNADETTKPIVRKKSDRVDTSSSAGLSDSAFEADDASKPQSLSSKDNSANKKRKAAKNDLNPGTRKAIKGSNSDVDSSAETEESWTRSKPSRNSGKTSIGRNRRTKEKTSWSSKSKKLANQTAVVSDLASEADVDDTTTKDNSSQGKNNKQAVSRIKKSPISVGSSSVKISDSTQAYEFSADDGSSLSTKSKLSKRSNVVMMSDVESDGWQSDREFLQQQVNILMTPFEITDCPELATIGKGRKRKKNEDHLPQDVIAKSLRKLNYKVEDELLKTLNRQGQRRILQQIQEIQLHTQKLTGNACKDSEMEDSGDLDSLKKMVHDVQGQLDNVQVLKCKAMKLEKLMDGIDSKTLSKEVKRANKLLQKIQEKVETKGMIDFQSTGALTTGYTSSHQEIVNKLFPQSARK